jgi:hypothetical protein
VFLDRGQAADPLVVGECLVISRNQTFDIGGTDILQSLNSDMAVEEEIFAGLAWVSRHDGWFDQTDFAD